MDLKPAIVITGAGGFLGGHVIPRLRAFSDRVFGVDVVPRPAGVDIPWHRQGAETLVDWPEPFVLVHLAWNMNRGDESAQQQSLAVFQKILTSKNLCAVVGLGSAEEYGEQEGLLTEDRAPGKSLSFYGQAKHEACCSAQTSGVPAIWLRPFIIYGEGQRGNMAIPYALRCAREKSDADFSSGEQFRDFIHVEDVAAGIAAAVQTVATLPKGAFHICNLGCGTPVKLRDVLERIAQNFGSQSRFHFGARPMRPGEPREQFASTRAAEDTLRWRSLVSWREGVDRLCQSPGPCG